MLMRTGWPCPTCGMTTSVSAAVRGRIGLSLRSQPMGLVLAGLVWWMCGAGLAQAVSGRDLLGGLTRRWALVLGLLAGGLLVGWGVKVLVGVLDGSLPLR